MDQVREKEASKNVYGQDGDLSLSAFEGNADRDEEDVFNEESPDSDIKYKTLSWQVCSS